MNSFIGWVGGKKALRDTIISKFPELLPKRYIEVFGGAILAKARRFITSQSALWATAKQLHGRA